MIPYILHVTVITTVCFIFYKLLLQKETFYRLNRWTLMGCLAVSFALPLLPVPREWSWRDKWSEPATPGRATADEAGTGEPKTVGGAIPEYNWTGGPQEAIGMEPATNDSKRTLPMKHARTGSHKVVVSVQGKPNIRGMVPSPAIGNPESAPASMPPTVSANGITTAGTPAGKQDARTLAAFFSGVTLPVILRWIFFCYLFGVVLFGINFLLQLAVLLYQSYSRPVIRDGRFRIVEISGNRAPCSFGNTIFINPGNYDWETYNQILIHEKIHVSGRHTLDILLAEMALVIQWFNPFAWLYRREVENNLEFLTDAHVLLHRNVERSAYQLSLLRVSAPHLPFSITNNYNHSLLKRRIVMMNSKRSSVHTIWKYFFLIPILTGLMCALNRPAIALAATTKKLPLPAITDTTKKPVKHTDDLSAAPKDARVSDPPPGDSKSEGSKATSSHRDAVGQDNNSYSDEPAAKALLDMDAIAVDQPDNASLAAIDAKVDLKLRMPEFKGFQFDDTVLTDGSWYATSYDDKLTFELKAGDDDHYWSHTIHVDKSEINPFPGQGTVTFKLVREAGTIVFKGQFDGQEGFGHFHYTPDAAYLPALKALGVDDLEDRRQFAFFAMNVKKDYVDMVVHNGYPHISQRDLLGFAAEHIDEAFIKLWHGVDIADADASEPRNLIRLKAMHIDRAYVDELKAAGYDHLSLHELKSMKAMHIDSNYLGELHKLGYDHLSIRDAASLYAQHVTPEDIRGFRDAGYKDAGVRVLTRFRSMNITPEFIKGFAGLGYTDLTAKQLLQLKAMNITPDYVREFNKIGFDHIPVNLLSSLKATGVNAEYVSKMRSQGFVSQDLVKYLRLKNDFN